LPLPAIWALEYTGLLSNTAATAAMLVFMLLLVLLAFVGAWWVSKNEPARDPAAPTLFPPGWRIRVAGCGAVFGAAYGAVIGSIKALLFAWFGGYVVGGALMCAFVFVFLATDVNLVRPEESELLRRRQMRSAAICYGSLVLLLAALGIINAVLDH
jgi:hypothetical protein